MRQYFRLVLRDWREALEGTTPSNAPDVLYYIPKKDVDSLVERIAPIAAELGVNLYQARIEIRQAGDIYGYDENEWGCDDVKLNAIDQEKFKVEELSTLDDVPVHGFTEVSINENEIIPEDFRDGLEADGEWDREFDGPTISVSIYVSCINADHRLVSADRAL